MRYNPPKTFADLQQLFEEHRRGGYYIAYEYRTDGALHAYTIPGPNEQPFETAEEAWHIAGEFSGVQPSQFVNIFVIDRHGARPPGDKTKINPHPPKEG